ncbi:hypothetical protein HY36_12670 [Hyphomonas atlantica]|uniref:Uncharacterized protein n=1 Tax=Hyphomonas atlantica TaxID=1280948 RepID=A0A059EAK3_9PROT|nr:hypothetical protein HY36_12670 [Hyphomonas atlantica]
MNEFVPRGAASLLDELISASEASERLVDILMGRVVPRLIAAETFSGVVCLV